MKPINLNFCVPFKIIYRNGKDSLNKKTVFDLSQIKMRYERFISTIFKKERFKNKIKSPLDTQIKQ